MHVSLECRKQHGKIYVSGDTYPHRETFRSMGGRFCWDSKSWMFTDHESEWDRVQNLCRQLQDTQADEQAHRPSPDEWDSDQTILFSEPSIEGLSGDLSESLQLTSTSSLQDNELVYDNNRDTQNPHQTKVYGVQELSGIVERQITKRFGVPIWIVGEIQDLSLSKGGHRYLTLAEPADPYDSWSHKASATLNACIWRDRYHKLKSKRSDQLLSDLLKDGMKIKIYARVSFYQKKGSISLDILDVDPEFTEGEIALARQKLLKELQQKGILHNQKALNLKWFPLKVGLITADGSRAYSDFIHQLNQNPTGLEILFASASMQGGRTSQEVCGAIRQLAHRDVDLIVLTRGGGSMADLHWFNDRDMAYAIAECPIPVVAAIGHHDDECVVQDVAFKALKTPTATAEYIHDLFSHLASRIADQGKRCLILMENSYESKAHQHLHIKERFQFRMNEAIHDWQISCQALSVKMFSGYYNYQHAQLLKAKDDQTRLFQASDRYLAQMSSRCSELGHRFFDQAKDQLIRLSRDLAELDKRFHMTDPLAWMEAGWAMVLKDGHRIRSAQKVSAGDDLELRIQGGTLRVSVQFVQLQNARKIQQKQKLNAPSSQLRVIDDIKK